MEMIVYTKNGKAFLSNGKIMLGDCCCEDGCPYFTFKIETADGGNYDSSSPTQNGGFSLRSGNTYVTGTLYTGTFSGDGARPDTWNFDPPGGSQKWSDTCNGEEVTNELSPTASKLYVTGNLTTASFSWVPVIWNFNNGDTIRTLRSDRKVTITVTKKHKCSVTIDNEPAMVNVGVSKTTSSAYGVTFDIVATRR